MGSVPSFRPQQSTTVDTSMNTSTDSKFLAWANHPYDSTKWRMGNAMRNFVDAVEIHEAAAERRRSLGARGTPWPGPARARRSTRGGARPGPTRAALCAARCAEAAVAVLRGEVLVGRLRGHAPRVHRARKTAAEQLPARCVWPCRPGLRMQRGRRRSVPGGSSRR